MSSLRDCLAVTHKRPAFRRKTWERRSKGRRGLSQERRIERGGGRDRDGGGERDAAAAVLGRCRN